MAKKISSRRAVVAWTPGGKKTTYKNLREFNATCTKRGITGGLCHLTNLRCTKEGGGFATVVEENFGWGGRDRVWRLHFNSCGVLRSHLKGRVSDERRSGGPTLEGMKRRRSR